MDGLFLGSDGILCAFSDFLIVDSWLLLSGKRFFVINGVRLFVLDEDLCERCASFLGGQGR